MSENLRAWVQEEAAQESKCELFQSRHDPDVRLVASSFNPDWKGEDFQCDHNTKRKPALPKRDEQGVLVHKTRKNFVMANAIQAILDGAEPSKKALPRDYLQKKDYGKAPAYLGRVKREIAAEKDRAMEADRQREREEAEERGREWDLDEEQRLELLEQLKAKWDDYNKQYQRQAHVVILDTAGRVARKTHLETMLTRIEKAIETLQRGPLVITSK